MYARLDMLKLDNLSKFHIKYIFLLFFFNALIYASHNKSTSRFLDCHIFMIAIGHTKS